MKYKTLILTAALAGQVHAEDNQVQGQSILTVGDDNVCGFSSIQTAVDAAVSGDVVRVASNKLYFENITISDKDLTVTGGYGNCTDANNNLTDLSRATVGDAGNHVFHVSGPNQSTHVEIRNLRMGAANFGITSTGTVDLTVKNVLLANNGGGASMISGNQTVTFEDVVIDDNSGPGILCTGSNNVVNVEGDSVISNNAASNNGGGMLITSGCKANVHAPTLITGNTAANHGGGVYVSNDALVNLNGIEISSNAADSDGDDAGDGGGLYVEGPFSIVNAVNVKFESNSAYRGGAVTADDNGRFTSYGANNQSNPCATPGECTSFTGNSVSLLGGVFYATDSGRILAMHALIRGNGAPGSGLVALANGGGQIEIEGSMIVKNGGEDLPATDLFNVAGLLDNSTRITLDHVTIADNELTGSVIRNSFGNFSLTSSIVQEEADVSSTTNEVSHTFECAIVNETDSFVAGGTVIIEDPLFINPGAGNYHIKPSSPAIDYCYDAASLTVELGYDIDLEGRNYDDPNVDDLHGTYDIGADEYRWDNDLIFMNGFEQD